MGKDRPDFWLAPAEGPTDDVPRRFRAESEHEVQRFHAAALAAGGTDNGEPGLRPQYHQNYYGAFALDPDGNNAEAVYHGAMQPAALGRLSSFGAARSRPRAGPGRASGGSAGCRT